MKTKLAITEAVFDEMCGLVAYEVFEDPAEMHAKVVMYRLFIKSQELQDELAKFEKEISQEWVAKRGLVV